jgi:hypothetical protein
LPRAAYFGGGGAIMTDENESVRRARPQQSISRAPAPAPRISGFGCFSPKPKVQTEHLTKLQTEVLYQLRDAVRKCEKLIDTGRALQKFPGPFWDVEKDRWEISRLSVDKAVSECREAGLSDKVEFTRLVKRCGDLDPDWAIACGLRRVAAEQSSVHDARAPVSETSPLPLSTQDGMREDIEKTIAQCRRFESKRAQATRDWSVWNGISWIAFRDSSLLCEIQNEDELRKVVLNGHPSLKAHDPEFLLVSALKLGQLRGIRDGEELGAYYWYGKTKVDRDIRLDRDALISIWRDDPWSLAQMMVWGVTRDPHGVEAARVFKPNESVDLLKERPQLQIRIAANELTQCCQQGLIQTFDGRGPIDPDVWKDLRIEFSDGMLSVQGTGLNDVNIAFSPTDALLQFRPYKQFGDVQIGANHEENAVSAKEIIADDDAGGNHEDGASDEPSALGDELSGIQASPWIIPADRPRGPSVLVAWLAMMSKWKHVIPRQLASGQPRSIEELTKEINRIVFSNAKFRNGIDDKSLLEKLRGPISETSVRRALGWRKK